MKVIWVKGNVFANAGGACIARSDEQLLAQNTLADLPRKSMFPAPRSEDKNVQNYLFNGLKKRQQVKKVGVINSTTTKKAVFFYCEKKINITREGVRRLKKIWTIQLLEPILHPVLCE